MMLKSGSRDK